MNRTVVSSIIVLVWACSSVGCGSSDASSLTGGLSFELLYRGPEQAVAYYTLDERGVLAFGGGMDAYMHRTRWKGELTPEDVEELELLIRKNQWFEAEPTSIGEPPPTYELKLRGPQGAHDYRVRGRSPAIDPVLDLLDKIARRRFDKYLDRFPQPGAQE